MEEQDVSFCVQALGCRRESFPQTYLGLPLSVQKLPISAFSPYIQKTDRHLSCWQAQLLNPMGRTVLVNSVIDSQLVYFMCSLQLPPSIIQQMDNKRRAFLWAGEKTGKSSPASCLVAWTNVCVPKDLGGLGVRDLGTRNICLLLKLIHRLHCPEASAWSQWVRARASVANLLGDIHGEHWDVLRSLLPLYKAITSVQLGNGASTCFWTDVWFGEEAFADLYPSLYSHCTAKDISVSDMINSGIQQALVPRLSRRAAEELQSVQGAIAQMTLSDEADRRVSPFFTSKDGLDSGAIYSLLKAQRHQADERSAFVWKNSAPPRVQLFMWLLLKKRIQCRSVLQKKHVLNSSTCEICNGEDEIPDHIISGCALGKSFWEKKNMNAVIGHDVSSLHSLQAPGVLPAEEFSAFLALCCWEIWKARNCAVFRNENISLNQLLVACKSTAEQWRFRFKRKKRHIVDRPMLRYTCYL